MTAQPEHATQSTTAATDPAADPLTTPASAELRRELMLAADQLLTRISGQALTTQQALRLRDQLAGRFALESDPQREGFLEPDGALRIVNWADPLPGGGLRVHTGQRDRVMLGHQATGTGLVGNGHLGADIVRCAAGGGFAPHTHIGDHLLFVVAGEGTITYDGRIYPTFPGQVYFVEGAVPHAVGAITDHVIIAIGSPHRAVDAEDRQTPREYVSVLADFASLRCELCDLEAHLPERLADLGCPHCPSQFL